MLLLNNAADLQALLKSPSLYSREPVSLLITDLNQAIVVRCEEKINSLKNQERRFFSIKMMLVALALLSVIYIHQRGFSVISFMHTFPLFIAVTLLFAIISQIIRRIYARFMIRREVKVLLRHFRRLQREMYYGYAPD